jgi:hypothetical protein
VDRASRAPAAARQVQPARRRCAHLPRYRYEVVGPAVVSVAGVGALRGWEHGSSGQRAWPLPALWRGVLGGRGAGASGMCPEPRAVGAGARQLPPAELQALHSLDQGVCCCAERVLLRQCKSRDARSRRSLPSRCAASGLAMARSREVGRGQERLASCSASAAAALHRQERPRCFSPALLSSLPLHHRGTGYVAQGIHTGCLRSARASHQL